MPTVKKPAVKTPKAKKVTPKKPAAAKTAKPAKAMGYLVEEQMFDYNDEYYSSYQDDASQLATNRVFTDRAKAEKFCLAKNRGQVDAVLCAPESWAGYDGPFGTYLANTVRDLPGDGFRKVCDVLLPTKKHKKLDRDDRAACAKALDDIDSFDGLGLTDEQRDVLIEHGPDIFSTFRVVEVVID